MARIRNDAWKDDVSLQEDLEKYVKRNYNREKEILPLMKKNYSQYAWSLCTLAKRLKHFGIKYIDYGITMDRVYNSVSEELDGPGGNLGYRSMTQKIRDAHNLKVPRDLIYDVMKELDPEGLQSRGGVGQSRKRKRNRRFVALVSLFLLIFIFH